ncbi:hypothetical protein ACNOYE_00185 [Nannocystaceae bacterium ST9]
MIACNGGSGDDEASDTNVTLTLGDDTTSGDGDTNNDTNNDTDSDGETTMNCPPGGCLDMEETDDTSTPGCASGDGTCNQVDMLFVIDNSGTMGEEQVNLSANFPLLIQKLQALQGTDGMPLNPDVNLMVTTTDLGHPQCTPFQPDGYEPAQGAPVNTACINRLGDFEGLGSNAPEFPEACTNGCPVAVQPIDPYIHFAGNVTNIPGNNVEGALSCIGPQGINGCGYEAQLEGMLQALNPGAEWNTGSKPFLRPGATLAVVIVTDEADCSVRAPEGYAYFTNEANNTYWEINPDTGTKTQATSAVCWNAGVNCGAPDMNGVYADCTSIDTGVLHPLTRYIGYLKDELVNNQNKDVIMLAILGIPEVTAHNPDPPFQPISGGYDDLVYRQWKDGPYPTGDILPGDDGTAASKEFEFGIGPGCTGEDGMGGFTGQAVPAPRITEVCQALDDKSDPDPSKHKIRCCMESVCDNDFSDAINCLTGIIQDSIAPIG